MWFEDQTLLKRIAQDPGVRLWDGEAPRFYESLNWEARYQDPSRVGTLRIRPLPGTEETLACWIFPVDLSKVHGILLGPQHEIDVLGDDMSLVYRGDWANCPVTPFLQRKRVFIWLQPPKRGSEAKSWQVERKPWYAWLGEVFRKK